MRQYKKKEILRIAEILLKANDALMKVGGAGSFQELADMLVSCQESAISLGTYIDTLDEKYAYMVRILEDYCENLYQAVQGIENKDLCHRLSKRIRKQLTRFADGVRNDLPDDKREAVFLPYKASMWDSLESIWRAERKAENTETYVIPIPYFDKDENGKLEEEHYEGGLYPPYVPVMDYKEYDFEVRKPDVVYIHNPYDNSNFVTSVHPYFFSKNLKNFTDKLVYVPYFILEEVNPEDRKAVDEMKHFCTVPAVFHADKVIVQSEDMRRVYVNVLTEELGNTKEARKYWEDKIEGTGSPKVDKLMQTKKSDIEIPEQWKKIIAKADGTSKKIIFYNNGISALLQHNGEMLKKMRRVFRIFKENQDEIALLWRPHPLIESTLASMRPQLKEEYREIKNDYRKEGWGIYDDTADIVRAIVISDAYYGDPSSVVQMYQRTGKPVMIEKVEV